MEPKVKSHNLCKVEYWPEKCVVIYKKKNPRLVEVLKALAAVVNSNKVAQKMWDTRYFDENVDDKFTFCTGFIPGKK